MTVQKARKRAIRARMDKTGERYTAARAHVVKPQAIGAPKGVDLGRPDEKVRAATGKGWDEWFAILDRWGATRRTHTDIARHLSTELGVPGWWAQTVTVGYERGRGMRGVNERVGGGYAVSVSKTVPGAPEDLLREFTDARKRNRWLGSGTLKPRPFKGKTARFDFRDGQSRVEVVIVPKDGARTTVFVTHVKLQGRDAVESMRAFWKERLAELAARLK